MLHTTVRISLFEFFLNRLRDTDYPTKINRFISISNQPEIGSSKQQVASRRQRYVDAAQIVHAESLGVIILGFLSCRGFGAVAVVHSRVHPNFVSGHVPLSRSLPLPGCLPVCECWGWLGHWQIIIKLCVELLSMCIRRVIIYFIITNKCVVWRSCCGDEYVERYRSRLLLVSQYVRPRRRRKRRLWQWQWRRRVMRCAS